jgi:hypothetical protein
MAGQVQPMQPPAQFLQPQLPQPTQQEQLALAATQGQPVLAVQPMPQPVMAQPASFQPPPPAAQPQAMPAPSVSMQAQPGQLAAYGTPGSQAPPGLAPVLQPVSTQPPTVRIEAVQLPVLPAPAGPPAAPEAPAPAAGLSAPVAPVTPARSAPSRTAAVDSLIESALSSQSGTAHRGRRAARKPRLAMSAVFADLVDMARIPRSAYAVDDEVTGAMCLFKTDGGYEVFSCAEDARHEVRFFEDEEAAYFYLFGVLAAEALRNGRLKSTS